MNLFNVINFDDYKNRYENLDFEILPEFLTIVQNLDYFTLSQVFKEIQDKHFSHLNPIFENSDELKFFTSDEKIQQVVFKAMGRNKMNRIDGFELIAIIHFCIQGNFEEVIENFISDIAGKETNQLNRDMFFYYFDAFFRALPKVTKLSDQQQQQHVRIARLNYTDLEQLCEYIFQDEEEKIQKNEAIKYCEQNPKNIFIEFFNHLKRIFNIGIKDMKNDINEIVEESMAELSLDSTSKISQQINQINQNDKKIYNNMDDLICPNCNNNFDLNLRLPRLFGSCGHSFCTKCIQNIINGQEQIFCPIDKQICDFYRMEKGINSLPINIALQKLIKSKEEENLRNTITQTIQKKHKKMRVTDFKGVNYCIDHQKIADLVCLTDKKEICTDCVLFGQHREHKYEKVAHFKQVVNEKIDEAVNFNIDINEFFTKEDMKEKLENKINSKCKELKLEQQKINDKIDEELQTKQKELIEIVEDQFEKFQVTTKFLGAQAREIKKSHEEINQKIDEIKNNLLDPDPDNQLLLEYLFSEKNLFKTQTSLIQEIKNTEEKVNKLLEYEINKLQFDNVVSKFIEYFLNNVNVTGATIQKNNLDQILTPGKPFAEDDIRMLSPIQQPHHQKVNFKKNKARQVSSDDISLVDMKFDVNSQDSQTLENVLNDQQKHKEKRYRKRHKKSKIKSFMHADLSKSFNRPKKKTQAKNKPYNMYHHSESSCSSDDKINDHETVLPQSHQAMSQVQKNNNNLKFISLDEAPSKYKTKSNKKYIDLKNKKITDNQLRKYISKLQRIEELEHLCLNNNKITDVGFKVLIAKLAKLPNLQKIELMRNSLTENVFKLILGYHTHFKTLRHFVFLQDDFENLNLWTKELDKLRSKGILLDFNQFQFFNQSVNMILIYFFLSLFKAQNFGYNQTLLRNRQFNTHYMGNSTVPQTTPNIQTQPLQIQQRQVITQPATSTASMNFYPNQIYNQRVDNTPQQRQNLILLDQKSQPQNLLTKEKLLQQLRQQVTNEMQRQSNQVEIQDRLQPAQVESPQQSIIQQLQQQQQTTLQQQVLNNTQQNQNNIQIQQRNNQSQQSQQQQSIIDQIFQQNNQSIQEGQQQQSFNSIFPNQNSQQNNNQQNQRTQQQNNFNLNQLLQNQQANQQQNNNQDQNPFLDDQIPSQNQNVNIQQQSNGNNFQQSIQNSNMQQRNQNNNFLQQNQNTNFQQPNQNTNMQFPNQSNTNFQQSNQNTSIQQPSQNNNFQQQNQGSTFQQPNQGNNLQQPNYNINFQQQNQQQQNQQQQNSSQQPDFRYQQNPLDNLFQQSQQSNNNLQQNRQQNYQGMQQQNQNENPFGINRQISPNTQQNQNSQQYQNQQQNYTPQQNQNSQQNYNPQQSNPYQNQNSQQNYNPQQNNSQQNYSPIQNQNSSQSQQQNYPQNQNRNLPQQQTNIQRPYTSQTQQQPQASQQKTQEDLNLFQLLTFDELMKLRGIGQDRIQKEQTGGFVEIEAIGKPKPQRQSTIEDIEQQYSNAGSSLNYQYSQRQQQYSQENQNQQNVFQNGTYRPQQQQQDENPFAEFNSGYRDERFNQNNQNFAQNINARQQQNNTASNENPFL